MRQVKEAKKRLERNNLAPYLSKVPLYKPSSLHLKSIHSEAFKTIFPKLSPIVQMNKER